MYGSLIISLKDLGYFPKGVLYYNNKIDEEALNIAENRHIQVIHFDMMEETRKMLSNLLVKFYLIEML